MAHHLEVGAADRTGSPAHLLPAGVAGGPAMACECTAEERLQTMLRGVPIATLPDGPGDFFPSPVWRDRRVGLTFYIHLAVFLAVAAAILAANARLEDDYAVLFMSLTFSWVELVGAIACSLLFSAALLTASYCWPSAAVHVSFYANIATSLLLAPLEGRQGSTLGGALYLLSALMTASLYAHFYRRFAFSTVLLASISDIVGRYPAIIAVSISSTVTVVLYGVLVVYTVRAIAAMSSPATAALLALVLPSAYWTVHVIGNVSRTIMSSIFAHHYLSSNEASSSSSPPLPEGRRRDGPTWGAIKRCFMQSFGSIAYGSLFVSLLQYLHYTLDTLVMHMPATKALCACLLVSIERPFAYFNYYGFTYVAIYGVPYKVASKASFILLESRRIRAIVNDNFIGGCILLNCFTIAMATSKVIYITYLPPKGPDGVATVDEALWVARLFAMISFAISYVAFQSVKAGVSATFVCLAEHPEAMRRSEPELYECIKEKYSQILLTAAHLHTHPFDKPDAPLPA